MIDSETERRGYRDAEEREKRQSFKLPQNDYFFYEWLIIEKKITKEKFEKLSMSEMVNFRKEYRIFERGLNERM